MSGTFHGKSVVVTGASGFIGSHLTESLIQKGARVKALVHYNSQRSIGNLRYIPSDILSRAELVFGDITDARQMHELVKDSDTVFHLAALIAIPYSYQACESYVRTNILGTLNVMEACKAHGTRRILVTSTSETYGTAQYVPIDEKHPLQGQSPYAATKIGSDKLAESFYLSFNLPVATARPFNTYGPRQSARAIIPTIITQLLSNQPGVKLGSLDPIRDFTFVKDTAEGLITIASDEQFIGNVTNIGAGSGVSIETLYQMLQTICGVNKPVKTDSARVRPGKSEVLRLICDNKKLTSQSSWNPSHSLEQGLVETVQFIRKNQGLFANDSYVI